MAGIAKNGATIADSTSSNHIRYRVWEYQYTTPIIYDDLGDPIGGGVAVYDWNYYFTHAIVKGTCTASSNSVFVNGSGAVLSGDRTAENDQYTIPSGEYVSGAHSGASGSVDSGNGRNVFIGGKSVSVNGSTVNTHASTNTTINQGSNNVFIGG